jgi:predicted Zn-dependent peptidase
VQNWNLTELDSGERVITERLEHVRSVAVGYWIGAGSRDEGPTEAGVSHFIEHLLFKGTQAPQRARDRRDLRRARRRAERGDLARAHPGLRARPDHHLETALDVMSDMVFAPAFAELETEREVVLEEIAMYEDTPQELVHDLIARQCSAITRWGVR